MPRMIGPSSLDRWEREVRRQLSAQLPHDWVVVCNVAWALPNDAGIVRDGQCDFVVLVPDLGMAILEVKGSRSVRVGNDGVWYRRDASRRTGKTGGEVPIEEPPPEQACRNMHTLAKVVCAQLPRHDFPGAFAYLVAYPNGVVEGAPTLYDASTIVAKKDVQRLPSRIRDALESRATAAQARSFTSDVMERVAAILSNRTFCVVASDAPLDAQEDSHDIEELTRQQFAALRGAFELPRVAIVGPAGSGKTLLALWKLEALIEEGKRALYVCFNKALAEHLRNANGAMANAITSVDRLFSQTAALPDGRQRDERFFREELPSLVLDAASEMRPSEKYEAIIVDEGQDFGELRLLALLDLLAPTGQWLFFADWGQDVYRAGNQELIGAEVTFRLYHNCRNTKRVNAATNGYCNLAVAPMPGAPIGAPPVVRKCQASAMATAAWAVAHELSPEGGCVFLSPYRLENSCMASARKGYGLQLTDDLSLVGKPGYAFFSTIKSFKGLEAQNVIVLHVDVPGRSHAFTEEDLYVACTRATGRLAILTSSDEASGWFSREFN